MGNMPVNSAEETRFPWIQQELQFENDVSIGALGPKVKIIQEWLSFHDFVLVLDGIFGPATKSAVRQFQAAQGISDSGIVDFTTFQNLVKPMTTLLNLTISEEFSFNDALVFLAQQHLAVRPREIGGQNCGSWVRLYMRGNDGNEWPWCAGFVSFIFEYAAQRLEIEMPFDTTFSCDVLAIQAQQNNMFISEEQLQSGEILPSQIPHGSIFLRRRSENDWNHTGIVINFREESIETIEGNSNDSGSREGYEVCKHFGNYNMKDFIRIIG